jgi:hypothetical protein
MRVRTSTWRRERGEEEKDGREAGKKRRRGMDSPDLVRKKRNHSPPSPPFFLTSFATSRRCPRLGLSGN